LHVVLQKDGIYKTNLADVPKSFVVNLWQAWHYSLSQVRKSSTNQEYIFLLKGKDLQPVYPAYFRRRVLEKGEIINAIRQSPNK